MNVQAIFFTAILLAAGAVAVVVGLPLLNKTDNNNLLDQVTLIAASTSDAVGAVGAAPVVDVEYLTDNGFLPKGVDYSDGVRQLLNGGTFTVLGDGATNLVAATFALDDEEQCNFLAANQKRFTKVVAASTTCSTAGLLTLAITR
jgi:hypothetical protein